VVDIDDAKEAVRETIKEIVQNGGRAYSQNVPKEAADRLYRNGAGTVARDEAWNAVIRASEQMVQDGELVAPVMPHEDWRLTP
jgi:hypothetical protein